MINALAHQHDHAYVKIIINIIINISAKITTMFKHGYVAYTLPANCAESLYPMAATTHIISINLEMYHCVAKMLFCAVN